MDEEADEDEGNQEELVKPRRRCHDAVLFHGDERRRLYRIRSLPNYPLPTGTGPGIEQCNNEIWGSHRTLLAVEVLQSLQLERLYGSLSSWVFYYDS